MDSDASEALKRENAWLRGEVERLEDALNRAEVCQWLQGDV